MRLGYFSTVLRSISHSFASQLSPF